MIIFDLICGNSHRFEGWFGSAEEFERQVERGQIACPKCSSTEVRRIPSAVHIATAAIVDPPSARPRDAAPVEPPLALYHQLVTALIADSEDTGTDFAAEARRIHNHEAPVRAIHGKSSSEEFEALRDEGIEVWRLPVFDKDKRLN